MAAAVSGCKIGIVRIALDATYSVGSHPSGIAVYSREILTRLADAYPNDDFLHCYRPKQLLRACPSSRANVRRRLLQPPLPTFKADLFHALNQRVDARPARKVVTTFHDLFVMTREYSSSEFRTRFTRQAIDAAARSDFIIAVSEFTASQVAKLLKFDRSRIHVIPHGVDMPRRQTQVHRENIILFVGALQVRKNVRRLVEAFGQVPDSWRLVLAGEPGGYKAEEILETIHRSKYNHRIQVTGYVSRSELDQLYTRASIFAFPSLDEGFGIPVLEAMAHGVPVVTSDCSALAEVAGKAAFLANPNDTDEIASALNRLIADPDLRNKLSELGRAHAALYNWDRSVGDTYSVYRRVLGC